MINHDVKAKAIKIKKHTFKKCRCYSVFLASLFLGLGIMSAKAMDISMPIKGSANIQDFPMPTKGDVNVEDFLTPTKIDWNARDVLAPTSVNPNVLNGSTEKPTLAVFISTSVPKPSLLTWQEEAKRYEATVVLRGFVNNSLQETLRALTLNDKSVLTVSIDPMAFEKHHVTAVPLVLFTDQDKEDKIAGNSGLQAALESIANQGDLHEEAKALLKEGEVKTALTQTKGSAR